MSDKRFWIVFAIVAILMFLGALKECHGQTLEKHYKGDTIYVQELSVYMDYETFISYALAKAQIDSSAASFKEFEEYVNKKLEDCNTEKQRLQFMHSEEMKNLQSHYAEILEKTLKKTRRKGWWNGFWKGTVSVVVVEIIVFTVLLVR